MLLLHLDRKKWVMIDCHLPDDDAKELFFGMVQKLGINRLDMLCLTHPHDDHYTGMADVVDYFTTGTRSLGIFCDTGVDPVQVIQSMRRLKRPTASVAEYEKLCRKLDELFGKKRVHYCLVNEGARIVVGDTEERVVLVPVGPKAVVQRLATRKTLAKARVTTDLNLLSAVFVLSAIGKTNSFRAQFPGDSDAESLRLALEFYSATHGASKTPCAFDVVKIPHHGSHASHRGTRLCGQISSQACSVAAISVGSQFKVLPDREVIHDYLSSGWVVLSTTKRVPRSHSGRLFDVFASGFELESNDLHVAWNEATGLNWTPNSARIAESELGFYETANIAPKAPAQK